MIRLVYSTRIFYLLLFLLYICALLALSVDTGTITSIHWSKKRDVPMDPITRNTSYISDPGSADVQMYLIISGFPPDVYNGYKIRLVFFYDNNEYYTIDHAASTFSHAGRIYYSYSMPLHSLLASDERFPQDKQTSFNLRVKGHWIIQEPAVYSFQDSLNIAIIQFVPILSQVAFLYSHEPLITGQEADTPLPLLASSYSQVLLFNGDQAMIPSHIWSIAHLTCNSYFYIYYDNGTTNLRTDVVPFTYGIDYTQNTILKNKLEDSYQGNIQMKLAQLVSDHQIIKYSNLSIHSFDGEYLAEDGTEVDFLYTPHTRASNTLVYNRSSLILDYIHLTHSTSTGNRVEMTLYSLNIAQDELVDISINYRHTFGDEKTPISVDVYLDTYTISQRVRQNKVWSNKYEISYQSIISTLESFISSTDKLNAILSISIFGRIRNNPDQYRESDQIIFDIPLCGTKYPNCNTPIIPTTPCDNKCDNITTICNSQNQCTCKNADLGWVIQTPSSSSSNSNDKIVCTRPCPCLNGGTCDWESSLDGSLQCMCTHNYDGPLCRDSIAPLVCNATTFLPSVCDKGTISCHDDSSSSSSPQPSPNETICTCSSPWLTSDDVINSGYGKWCNLCPLQVQPSQNKPHKYCHPTNTHRVSYTTSRCANDICVCNKGYTGDTCQHNAAYAEIIFDTSNTFDGSQYTDPIAYRDALIEYITQYISTTLPIFSHDEIMEMVKLYGTDIQMDNATPQGAGGSPMISSFSSSLYSLLGVDTTGEEPTVTDSNNWICPDGQIPTVIKTQYKCIKSIKYTFIFDMTMIQDKFDKSDSGDGNGNGNGDGFAIMTNLESLYTAWNNAITDMPDKQPDITNTIGTPSTESLYDPIYCNTFLNDPTTTIPSQCLQVISYKDTEWNNEADADDLLYGVLLPNRPSSSSDKSSNVGIIIGVVVGACAVFVVLLLVLCYLKKTKKGCFAERQKNRKNNDTVKSSGVEFSTASERTTTAVPDSVGTVSSFSPVPNPTKSPLHGGSSLPSPVSADGVSTPTSPIDSRPLPDGWKLLRDPNSGKVYYYNETTLTSSWKHPDDIKDEDASSLW